MSKNMQSHEDLLTGEKQTREAWTSLIEAYDDVPEIYRDAFEQLVPNQARFPYTLLAPSLIKSLGRTTEKLIVDARTAIHLLERNGTQVIKKSYPYQNIFTVELGSILLGSWLTISGTDSTGAAANSTIDFNTSSLPLYSIFIDKLRPTPASYEESQRETEKDKFDYLSASSFKLMNYGRESLVCGEKVIQILLQTEIKRPVWAVLVNWIDQTVSPAHLTILTDLELILIQDVTHDRKVSQAKYGGIWQYIPLHSIKTADWREMKSGWLTLSITVSPDKVIEKLFEASHRNELEQLCAALQERSKETHAIV
ncbi:MAG: hypothetical protein ACM3XO_00830 [Bacteroidota bacterium]